MRKDKPFHTFLFFSGISDCYALLWPLLNIRVASANSIFTLAVDAATQIPLTFSVQTTTPSNFLENFDEPTAVADETYSFSVQRFSVNNKNRAISKAARLPAKSDCSYLPGFAPTALGMSLASDTSSAGSQDANNWTPDWQSAAAFFAAKSMGLANLSTVTNLTQVLSVCSARWIFRI